MNLLVLLVNWYTLLYLQTLSDNYDNFNGKFYSHRNYKFRADMKEYLDLYTSKLDFLFRDYIICSAANEADDGVHGESHFKLSPWNIWDMRNILRFKKDALIETLKSCFRDFLWNTEFGGEPWYNALASLSISNPVIFVDHVVDLHHNTGTLLNKGILGLHGMNYAFTEAFDVFLNAKKKLNLVSFVSIYGNLLNFNVKRLFKRFLNIYGDYYLCDKKEKEDESDDFLFMELWNSDLEEKHLGLIARAKNMIEKTEDNLLAYTPLRWKGKDYLKLTRLCPPDWLYEVNGIVPPDDAVFIKLEGLIKNNKR